MVPGFQYPEQGVIFQPVRMLMAELLIGDLQVPSGPGVEIAPGCFEYPEFERGDGIVIDGGFRKGVA